LERVSAKARAIVNTFALNRLASANYALRHVMNPTPPKPTSNIAQVDGSGIPSIAAPVKVTLILTPPSPNPVPDSRPSLVVQGTDSTASQIPS
jgi:hypothetical protein